MHAECTDSDRMSRAIALGRLKTRLYATMTDDERKVWDEWHDQLLSKCLCLNSILDAIKVLQEREAHP